MDVIKIDIEQQRLAIRESALNVYKADISGNFDPIEHPDKRIIYTSKHYEVITKTRAVQDSGGGLVRVEKKYLIPMAERGLFTDLVDISDNLLARLIDEAKKEDRQRESDRIKGLAWWKRLLKRF